MWLLSRLRRELEDDFVVSYQAELVARDSLYGFWVALEFFDFEVELPDIFSEFSVFRFDLFHFGFEGTQSGQAFLGKHEGGGSDGSNHEDEQGESPFQEERLLGHGRRLP